jgi:hypothetical protein
MIASVSSAVVAAPLDKAESRKRTEAYIANVFASDSRTLAHYFKFESASSEYEERLIVACQRGATLPLTVRGACGERLRKGESKNTPSLFIPWVKEKLPIAPHQVSVMGIRRIDRGTPFEGDLVRVDLNGVELEFFHHDDQTQTGPKLGRYSLVSIGGVRVSKLLEQDLANAR